MWVFRASVRLPRALGAKTAMGGGPGKERKIPWFFFRRNLPPSPASASPPFSPAGLSWNSRVTVDFAGKRRVFRRGWLLSLSKRFKGNVFLPGREWNVRGWRVGESAVMSPRARSFRS